MFACASNNISLRCFLYDHPLLLYQHKWPGDIICTYHGKIDDIHPAETGLYSLAAILGQTCGEGTFIEDTVCNDKP